MKKYALLLFVISIIYTIAINTYNLKAIREKNPENKTANARSLIHNSTIYSIDNYWYVNHVKNYLQYGKFTVDIKRDKYEVRRTPVYPLFYGIHYLLFGEAGSYHYIRYTQVIMLALAVVALFYAMYNFTGSLFIALLTSGIYALFPPVAIATFFTNTESINSILVCYFLYVLSLCKIKPDRKRWFLAGLLFAVATLCRPSIIFLAPACLFVLIYFYRNSISELQRYGIAFAIGVLILFVPWTVRNYKVSGGDLIFLEKYYGDPMDYGMGNVQLRKWIACWTNPPNFSSEQISNEMLRNIRADNNAARDSIIEKWMNKMPSRAFIGNSRESVADAFRSLFTFYEMKVLQERNKDNLSLSDSLLLLENTSVAKFGQLKTSFITKSPVDYYLITPLHFVKSVILQSNSTSLTFLDNYSGNLWKTGMKAVMYLLNVSCYIALVTLIFIQKKRHTAFYWMSVIFISCSFFAIIYILQHYEARYNFPLFPFLFGLLAWWTAEILRKISGKEALTGN